MGYILIIQIISFNIVFSQAPRWEDPVKVKRNIDTYRKAIGNSDKTDYELAQELADVDAYYTGINKTDYVRKDLWEKHEEKRNPRYHSLKKEKEANRKARLGLESPVAPILGYEEKSSVFSSEGFSALFGYLVFFLPLGLWMIKKGGKARKEGRGSENAHDFVTSPSYSGLYYYGWIFVVWGGIVVLITIFESC